MATRFANFAASLLIATGILAAGAVTVGGFAHPTTAVRADAATTVSSAASATPTGTASPNDIIWG